MNINLVPLHSLIELGEDGRRVDTLKHPLIWSVVRHFICGRLLLRCKLDYAGMGSPTSGGHWLEAPSPGGEQCLCGGRSVGP